MSGETIGIVSADVCAGCGACAAACPNNAVSMAEDELGFLRPVIDAGICVTCGVCTSVCPALNRPEVKRPAAVYAAWASDESARLGSSSGGIFPLLAGAVTEQGGVVFGAAFDGDFGVRHTSAETTEELERLRGSKYVQSDAGCCFGEAHAALESGRLVYFSGTPCQIAGLMGYLGREYENLITQDVVCHSAPSPGVWKKYREGLEARDGGPLTGFSFRFKRDGWEKYYIHGVFEGGGEYLVPASEDPYMKGFLKGLYSRESCFSCAFRGLERTADITLCDYWGVKRLQPEAYQPEGTSLVLLRSAKARRLFASVATELSYYPADPDRAFTVNTAAVTPIRRPARRSEFLSAYDSAELEPLIERCCLPTAAEKRSEALRASLPYRAARKLRRLLGGSGVGE